MSKRDFLALTDCSAAELRDLLRLASDLKSGRYLKRPLVGKTLAMIFAKSSTRTRVSFEVGVYQLGGYALFLSARDIQVGRGELVRDTARVLGRYVNGIMIRTFAHAEAEELARYAPVPVINGLTDLHHPCQVLADVMTIEENLGPIAGKAVAWVGDGNNMANSWLHAAGLLGFELRLACPEGYDPDASVLAWARERTPVLLTREPGEAVRGAHTVNTDVWASMGHEEEAESRAEAFGAFRVTGRLMAMARPEAVFLHCLPAHRGEEVDNDVLEGSQSRVFDEAENRLHVQKALMVTLMAGKDA